MGKQNRHAGDLVEHTGDFFLKVDCIKYDIPSKVF
jgi:hypothetical protein